MSKEVKAIVHACFGTNSIRNTRDFYCKVLDSKVVHEFRNSNNELYGLILNVGKNSFLEFFLDKTSFESQQMFRHLCFAVDDIQATKRKLESCGLPNEIKRGKTDFTLQLWINCMELNWNSINMMKKVF